MIGKIDCLLLKLTKALYTTGEVCFILDSGFVTFKPSLLSRDGSICRSLDQKCKYWPKWVESDAIDKHMEDCAVGECDSFRGKLNSIDYEVFHMKKTEYVMKIMSTYYVD